ncbi:MAG: hypothetical protein RLZZ188_3369 [Verrucomicrobiota bacterium]
MREGKLRQDASSTNEEGVAAWVYDGRARQTLISTRRPFSAADL